MIGARNTRSQKYLVGVIQATPCTPVSEEIADIFRNYNIDIWGRLTSLQWKTVCDKFVNFVSKLDVTISIVHPNKKCFEIFTISYIYIYILPKTSRSSKSAFLCTANLGHDKRKCISSPKTCCVQWLQKCWLRGVIGLSTGFNGERVRANS